MTPTQRTLRPFAPAVLAVGLALAGTAPAAQTGAPPSSPAALLPAVSGWSQSEAPRTFAPENLFEYIDGAAESYIGYDFRELATVPYQKEKSEATLTVEVYDMGTPLHAFGIFSSERYPENPPVEVGMAGYMEGEALNFASGRYYVKLLAYGTGDATASTLLEFARRVDAGVKDKGALPEAFALFPPQGRVARSEKYVLKNFLGFEELHDGYVVGYKSGGAEFEAFAAQASDPPQAKAWADRLVAFYARDGKVETVGGGPARRVVSSKGSTAVIAPAGRYTVGAARIPQAAAADAEKVVLALAAAASR